ncbi:tyrosine-type recombinase/integrase [Kribbella sp. NBC_01505]|uniref:tyrosine-type recombinase/integrase n=1 Tax=Kribbella sp. NBC_01505 TaxID=2903580 RepID=UPI00386A08D6
MARPAGGTLVRSLDTGDETLRRMQLRLDPRFDESVITFSTEQDAAAFAGCHVDGCLRERRSNGLCWTHVGRWDRAKRPPLAEFMASPGDPTKPESVGLDGLPDRVRLEIALALQLAPARGRQFYLGGLRKFVSILRELQPPSLLGEVPPELRTTLEVRSPMNKHVRLARHTILAVLEEFCHAGNPLAEFERDTWRAPVMGLAGAPGCVIRFDAIPQPWLRHQAKRFLRWRISTGKGYAQINRDNSALERLAAALTAQAGPDALPSDFNRATIETYLNLLVERGLAPASRGYDLSSIRSFLRAVRQQEWQPLLPTSADVFPGDRPRLPKAAPRWLPEFVMAQIEDPTAQDQLEPKNRLLLRILIRTGLRINDAGRLELDCIVRDNQNAPYLRYYNHKMRREAFVPVDDELADEIRHQQQHILADRPAATCLFPQTSSLDGTKPRCQPFTPIAAWQGRIGLRDELGRPFRFTAHQLRHTYGTRLINADVPQEVVRRLLDHESPEMTARYARLKDDTIRRHWERARKVNIAGETLILEAGTPLSDAVWMKENLGRATMALPNGYCGLPLQQTCPHANACLTCPVFITTPDFLSEHLEQLRATNRLIATAEARGNTRIVEMNQRVATNLKTIIDAIQTPDPAETGDAS